jgi:GNAT superfamily N-acetyltransferase
VATIAPKPSKESMLKIRSFQPADSEAVRHLFTQGHLNSAQDPELEEEVRRFIQYSLSDDLSDISRHYLGSSGNHFWVAEVEGQIKGTVGIQRRNDGGAELRRMSVAADSRRQGIGGELLKTAEEFCRGEGYQCIHLSTALHLKPAIALYQKAGYQLICEEQYGRIIVQHFVKHLSDGRTG